MILNCSIPKGQLKSQTVQRNIRRNKHLESLPPTPGLERVKNNMPDPIGLIEDKAKMLMKVDKS